VVPIENKRKDNEGGRVILNGHVEEEHLHGDVVIAEVKQIVLIRRKHEFFVIEKKDNQNPGNLFDVREGPENVQNVFEVVHLEVDQIEQPVSQHPLHPRF
jgi:hypothetical protein